MLPTGNIFACFCNCIYIHSYIPQAQQMSVRSIYFGTGNSVRMHTYLFGNLTLLCKVSGHISRSYPTLGGERPLLLQSLLDAWRSLLQRAATFGLPTLSLGVSGHFWISNPETQSERPFSPHPLLDTRDPAPTRAVTFGNPALSPRVSGHFRLANPNSPSERLISHTYRYPEYRISRNVYPHDPLFMYKTERSLCIS